MRTGRPLVCPSCAARHVIGVINDGGGQDLVPGVRAATVVGACSHDDCLGPGDVVGRDLGVSHEVVDFQRHR